jgi:hypothetical protein
MKVALSSQKGCILAGKVSVVGESPGYVPLSYLNERFQSVIPQKAADDLSQY